MNRLVFTVEIAAALATTAYVLIALAQNPDHPAVGAAELLVGTLLTFAAFVAGLALYVAARLGSPRVLCEWRRHAARRAARRLARERARRMQRRHAARTGGAR